LVVGAAACTTNPLDPGAGSDPGSGTRTLVVVGRAIAEASTPNATAGTSFTTSFDVDVTLADGTPVTTGSVTVRSRARKTELAYAPSGTNIARWSGDAESYDEAYELDVVSGGDAVRSVIVDGPDIHVFTAPALGASLDPSVANNLAWRRAGVAQSAVVRVGGGGDGDMINDSGSYVMPALTLSYEKDQTKANTIRLTRTNAIAPKGGADGSSFTVGVANEIDVVAMACPSCP
jgi:hypothetical protein